MASGQIKKGFFFYFGMFTLLLVTVFLICLVIMIFCPGKAVLWMKYFTGNEVYVVEKTTDTGAPISWGAVNDIVISAPNYAKVTVQHTHDNNIGGIKEPDTGIYIVNHAKGFQGASGAVDFGFDVTYNVGKLKISLKEPNGFLFFSKDIEVVVHTSIFARQTSLNDKNLVVLGGAGDVAIGKAYTTDESVKLKSLYVSTTSGNVSLEKNFDTTSADVLTENIKQEDTGKNNIGSLYISTGSGSITASQLVSNGAGSTVNGLVLKTVGTFKTDSGDIRLGRVESTSDIQIECKQGTVVSNYMKTSGDIKIKCTHGNYDIDKVEGNLSFVDALETIISPNITIGEVTGSFTIGTAALKSSPDVNISKVGGTLTAYCDSGTLTVGEAGGIVLIESDKMTVNIKLAETNKEDVSITNGTASTNLSLRGAVGDRGGKKILVKTHGAFVLSFTGDATFRARTYKYDKDKAEQKGDPLPSNTGIININGYVWEEDKSNFNPRDYQGAENITIITGATGNGSVVFNKVDKI